ncbi:pilus assembly protein [Chelativorans sp.]|uniref:TadE/TadG family type IV pilus assembly protein n=1 Tax=Chelativorans sp. TaxID=2203393 RepID=UPI002810F4B8|nr:pilus assembly protein [Chelativorans sp.]
MAAVNTKMLRLGLRIAQQLRAFAAERRGVAALEFALVVPLMLGLYFLTMEFSQALETNSKVSRVASQVADLVAQQPAMTVGELRGIMELSEAALQPYRRSGLAITVTAIQVTFAAPLEGRVVWSQVFADGQIRDAEQPGRRTEVPESLLVPGIFLIRAEARLHYLPLIVWAAGAKDALGLTAAFDQISMGERYYLRPRQTPTIPCSDC